MRRDIGATNVFIVFPLFEARGFYAESCSVAYPFLAFLSRRDIGSQRCSRRPGNLTSRSEFFVCVSRRCARVAGARQNQFFPLARCSRCAPSECDCGVLWEAAFQEISASKASESRLTNFEIRHHLKRREPSALAPACQPPVSRVLEFCPRRPIRRLARPISRSTRYLAARSLAAFPSSH